MSILDKLGSFNGAGMDYLVPSMDDREDKKLAWQNHVVESGRQYIKNQEAYKHIRASRDAVMGVIKEKMPKSLSRITLNRPKRQIREIVSVLSNLRNRFEYKSDNKEYYNQATILNNLAKTWWLTAFVDRKMKEGLQYAATDGIGYVGLSWDRSYWTGGRGEIVPHVYSAEQVLPYQIGEDHDLQKAYAVTIVNRVPIAHAHALFRGKAHLIKPDAEDKAMPNAYVGGFSAPVLNMFGSAGGKKVTNEPWPMVTLRYTYIIDNTVNTGSRPKMMGIPGASWSYTVPAVGGKVPAGYDMHGELQHRSATEEDAMLFPMRRLMISTPEHMLYDGSNTQWHGQVPVIPFYFDKWPMEYLPFGLISEVMGVHASNITMMRAVDDSQKTRLRPPMMFDNRVVDEAMIRKMDLRQEAQMIGVDFSQGDKPIVPLVPQQHYDVPNWIPEWNKHLMELADYQIGIADWNALAKAKQIPSGDTMEALLQAIGPLVTDMTRGMEHSLRGMGEQWKAMAVQFYDKPRIIQMQGKDQASLTEFEFDPMSLVPKYAPGEKPEVVKGKAMSSMYSQTERARKHIDSFYMYIEPNSLSKTEAMSQKLLNLQLFRGGYPIDPWTLSEVLEIPNFGPAPEGANTIMEKWMAWKDIQNEQAVESAEMMMKMQMMAQGGGVPGGLPGVDGNMPAPGVGEQGNASGVPGQAGPGRPPSGQKAPQLEAKGDGRPVISES